jgi:hypothetical protein
MRYAKFSQSTGQIISILVEPEEDTVEIDDDLVNQFHARPKTMLFYRVVNGKVVHKDEEQKKLTLVTPEPKIRSWGKWEGKKLPTEKTARVIITFKDSCALIKVFREFEGSIYFTDVSEDMWILGSLDKVESGKLYLNNLREANVWSKDDYTDCFIVDNNMFERAVK